MKLQDFLKIYRYTQAECARETKMSRAAINNYIKGKRFPNRKSLEKISIFSNGKVTKKDFYA